MLELFLICLVIAFSLTLGLSLLITLGDKEWKKFFYNFKMTSIVVGIATGVIFLAGIGVFIII